MTRSPCTKKGGVHLEEHDITQPGYRMHAEAENGQGKSQIILIKRETNLSKSDYCKVAAAKRKQRDQERTTNSFNRILTSGRDRFRHAGQQWTIFILL